MATVYVESNLASPLSANVPFEINPKGTARELMNNFMYMLQQDDFSGIALYDEHHHKLDLNLSLQSQGIQEGAKLYVNYDKATFFHPVHGIVIGAFTLLIAVVLFIVVTILFYATGGTIPFDYGIVIDAGSTHTEAFLYQWSGIKEHGTGEVHQKACCEYEDGIANGYDPVNIVSCLNNITSWIPNEISSTRLYLGATGGMRLENLTDPIKANLILMAFKYALVANKFKVQTVDIIQGEDEAIFSWISTNFLKQILNKKQMQETYGALDLGGASTQYAFAVNNETEDISTKMLELYGHPYFVSSRSFLCFGYYEAMDRNEAIQMMTDNTASIADPCLPDGFTREFDADSFSQKPCLQNKNFSLWLERNSNIDELHVTGSSNYFACKERVQQLLNESTCKSLGFGECLQTAKLGPTNKKFMAFSGFYYVVKFLNGTESLDELIKSTKAWCGLTWNEIKQTQPESELHHVSRYCFASIFITELLTSIYMFDSSSWKNIFFVKEISGTDVGWSLGFMINATNAIPEEHPSLPVISLKMFVSFVICSIFMTVIGILMLKKYMGNYCSPVQESLLNIQSKNI